MREIPRVQRITTCGEQCADIINEDNPVRNRFRKYVDEIKKLSNGF